MSKKDDFYRVTKVIPNFVEMQSGIINPENVICNINKIDMCSIIDNAIQKFEDNINDPRYKKTISSMRVIGRVE